MTIHFCHLLKNGFRQVLPCQKISVFEVEYNFLISGTNCMWKKTINFCRLPKMYPVPFQKMSVFETEYAFWNQRNEMFVKDDYQFLSLFKNISQQELPCQKALVFEKEYNFFNQRNKKYVEEAYQILQPFKKCIPTKTSTPKSFSDWNFIHFFQLKQVNAWENKIWLPIIPCQKFQCLKMNTLLSIKGRKCMWKKTTNFCQIPKYIPTSISAPKKSSV